ncbi:hypothetical protein HanRHA438_Chr12g0551061 [Helianthus annuus]|nr:hypothetical protein HanRHA438_Chr12g0551061 [Helianthus annuus]
MMISTTSRYSPPGPPIICGNIGECWLVDTNLIQLFFDFHMRINRPEPIIILPNLPFFPPLVFVHRPKKSEVGNPYKYTLL